MYHGIIVIKKEAGYTSHDVVAKMRGICGQKKIGHTGTLDPDAEGVLPICLGKGTKVSGFLTDSDKEYEAVLTLGVTTDTQDLSGEVIAREEVVSSESEVRDAIKLFVGDVSQIPPMYSALKVNGQKLCDLARQGIEVERKARKVQIYDITILEMNLPEVRIRVSCSKGTYIRTLCHDIGAKLGCGGAMKSLLRTKAAGFTLEHAYTLKEVQDKKDAGNLAEIIHPIDAVYECYDAVYANEKAFSLLQNGNSVKASLVKQPASKQEMVRMYNHLGEFVGIFTYRQTEEDYRPVKMFLAE